jgi:hypothetical protein
MVHEVPVLIGQDVGVRDEIVGLPPKFLLHLHVVEAQAIFPGDFVGLWEVVDSLELVETLVQVSFTRAARPEEVPLVGLRVSEPIGLADGSYESGVPLQHLVE